MPLLVDNSTWPKNLLLKLSLLPLKLSSVKPCPCHIQPCQLIAFYAKNVLDFSLRFGQDTSPGPACVVGPAVSLVHDYVGFVS